MITEISTDLTKKYVKKILEKNYDKLETSAAKENQLIGSGIVVYVLDNLKFTTTGKLKSAGKVDFYKAETKLITTLKKYRTKILVVTDLKAYKRLRQEILSKNMSDGEKKAYNTAVNSADMDTVKLAVDGFLQKPS